MIRDDFHLFFVFLLFNVVERQYKKKRIRDMDENNVPVMRPTFEEIRKVDGNGKEYWSSRDLCNAMGYSGYWKFQNVIDKAIKVASEKGMNIDEHFNHAVDMFKVGNGAFRKVEAFHLSRMACMIISENADSRKLLVKQARAYFSQSVSTTELMQNSLESNILLYKTAQGETRIEVIFNNETFWMSQKRMAALFGVDRATITYHISQIYESGELQREATCRKIQQVQLEGERDVERAPLFYNLDVIIAVGYRVNSYQATQFRIWATSVLKEFIIKGYVLDDERLKQGKHFGKDYFDDLLERIREIRTSERRYYQKITDIYAECSADYDAKAESTKLFYKMVQNMMHLAVTNKVFTKQDIASEDTLNAVIRTQSPKSKNFDFEVFIMRGEKTVQIIPFSYPKDDTFDPNGGRKDSCLMADVTFDGNKDLLVYLGQFGNQGVEYWDAYVWNEVKQKFLFVPSFHDIPNPTLNEKEKIIESFSRGSAVDYEFGKWKFEKGVFVQKELLSHPPRESE